MCLTGFISEPSVHDWCPDIYPQTYAREETTVACEFVCSSLATFVQSKTAVGLFFFPSLVDLYNIRHIYILANLK